MTSELKPSAISRRRFLKAAGVTASAIAAPAVILRPGWAQTGPIKLGLLEPFSGATKYVGDGSVLATTFVIEQINAKGGLLGRQLEIVQADSELKVDVAARRANDLIHGEGVVSITSLGSAIAAQVAPICNKANRLFLTPYALPRDMTGGSFLPTTFGFRPSVESLSSATAHYFAQRDDVKNVYLMNQDYNTGHSAAETFKRVFQAVKRPDQQIVGEELVPLFKTQDFGPHITKIMASGADGLMTSNWGPDLTLLLKQGAEFGWKVKAAGSYLEDPAVAQGVGDAIVGHAAVSLHVISTDTPENTATIKAWRERFPDASIFARVPDGQLGTQIAQWRWFAEIVNKVGSLDTEAIVKGWEETTHQAIWGPISMRACDHTIRTDVFVGEFKKPADLPEEIRYWPEFPYVDRPLRIPAAQAEIAKPDTGNARCMAG